MKQETNTENHLSLSITEGRIVRDLVDNNLLDEFENQNYKTTIYSEASNATAFTDIIKNPEVDFRYLYPCGTSTPKSRAYWMRRRLNKIFNS